jgi:hypothetical protein
MEITKMKKIKRKLLSVGSSYDDEVKSTLSGIKNINKDQKEKAKKYLKAGKEPNFKETSLDKLKNIFKKSDGSMENKVIEKIGKEADNVLKEKLLKGLDDEKAEIETMKEIKEKYGFKKGGLVKQGKPKLAKKGWR